VNAAVAELGITLRWEGEGIDEIGIVDDLSQMKTQNSRLAM
jgi:GDPmannose 4,6-dehydratase